MYEPLTITDWDNGLSDAIFCFAMRVSAMMTQDVCVLKYCTEVVWLLCMYTSVLGTFFPSTFLLNDSS